jgi:hypothetical protein
MSWSLKFCSRVTWLRRLISRLSSCCSSACRIDAHDVRVPLADDREQIDPTHLGHALVGDHDLRGLAVEDRERLLGAGGRQDLPGLVPQQALHGLEDVHLVVDEQNGVLLHGPLANGVRGLPYQGSCQVGSGARS